MAHRERLNSEEFQLHLRNLVNQHFGRGFAASKLMVSFPAIGNKEISRIEIKRANSA